MIDPPTDPPPTWTQAVAFDFDGVVCQSAGLKTDAFAVLYDDCGPEACAAMQAHHRRFPGVSRYDKIRHVERAIRGREPTDAEVEARAARFAELVEAAVIAAPLLPGAAAVLADWPPRIPLFVISATPQDELRRIVTAKGLTGCFRAVLGTPTGKAAHLAAIRDQGGLDPVRMVMVGDALVDHDAAAAVGCRFVGIVPPGALRPFPPGILVRQDLIGLGAAIADATVPARLPSGPSA